MKSQQNRIELVARPDVFKKRVANVHSMEWDAQKMNSAVQRSAGRTGNVFQRERDDQCRVFQNYRQHGNQSFLSTTISGKLRVPHSIRISEWLTEFGPLPWQAKQGTVSSLFQL